MHLVQRGRTWGGRAGVLRCLVVYTGICFLLVCTAALEAKAFSNPQGMCQDDDASVSERGDGVFAGAFATGKCKAHYQPGSADPFS